MNEANTILTKLSEELESEIVHNILPFWMNNVIDERNGGFHGQLSNDNIIIENAPRSAILFTRILWTFSASYRVLRDKKYLEFADRAYKYILDYFWDDMQGGIYWMVDHTGKVSDPKKHTYAQAFAIYAFSEYCRATTNTSALNKAKEIYSLLERHGYQPDSNGYLEAFSREWKPLNDVRLSEKDEPQQRSMNTHLHLLEAYVNLFRVWPDKELEAKLKTLITLFLNRIYNSENGHYYSFFDDNWVPQSDIYSFGHDIEAAWLILDAAKSIGDDILIKNTTELALQIADITLKDGLDRKLGGVYNLGSSDSIIDTDKVWWVQAESIVGFVYAFLENPKQEYLDAAVQTWEFTKQYIIDRKKGEWFFRVDRIGIPYLEEDKVGVWKCPYHNVRTGLELVEKISNHINTIRE